MEPKQHKSDCVNENSSFKRIRQQHGNIPPSALWNLFVKCNYNEDETMLTLHSELIPSSQGGKDCVCNCDLHEEMTEFGSQETYCEEIENEAMNAKITEFNNQETYCEEIENGAINMTTTSIRIPCADCEMYHKMLGRNLEKNITKKWGVCSKHRQNNDVIETPPGDRYWNPKMPESNDQTFYY